MKLLRSYFFWTYERGSLHYDIMVTLILAFIFISPHYIDYKDKPVADLPQHASDLIVHDHGPVSGGHEFEYEIRTDRLNGDLSTDASLRSALAAAIQPISGDARIEHYQPVMDAHGETVAYSVWIVR